MPGAKKKLHETIPKGMLTIAEVARYLRLPSYIKARDTVLSGKCGIAIRHTDGRTWLVAEAGVKEYDRQRRLDAKRKGATTAAS